MNCTPTLSNVDCAITAAVSAYQVLLVFVTIVFGIVYGDIMQFVNLDNRDLPSERNKKNQMQAKLRSAMITRLFPLLAAEACILMVYVPVAFSIIGDGLNHGAPVALDFDVARTGFVLMCLLMSAVSVGTVALWKAGRHASSRIG